MTNRSKLVLAPWAAILEQPSRYKAIYGGRGASKSHSMAGALVAKLAKEPLRWLCAREVQTSLAESSKRTIEDKIHAAGLSAFFKITDREIRGANGSQFLFAGLGTDPEKIKSMEGLNGAWVSEANTVSKRSLELLTPTVREPGSEIWFDWNPDQPSDPVDEMFRGAFGPPPNSIVRQVLYKENPWFPDVLREELEWDRSRDPDKYAHVWLGAYRRVSEAAVFRNWKVASFATPADARLHFGADWGFSVDPTVLVRSFIGRWVDGRATADPDGDTLFVDYEVVEVGCAIDAHPDLFDRIPASRRWPIVADSSRPEMIDFLASRGFRVRAAKKGAGSVQTGVEYLRQFNLVVHPRCPHTADELALYSWRVDRRTGDVLPVLSPGNDHCIDALRYAHEGMRPKRSRFHFASSGMGEFHRQLEAYAPSPRSTNPFTGWH